MNKYCSKASFGYLQGAGEEARRRRSKEKLNNPDEGMAYCTGEDGDCAFCKTFISTPLFLAHKAGRVTAATYAGADLFLKVRCELLGQR